MSGKLIKSEMDKSLMEGSKMLSSKAVGSSNPHVITSEVLFSGARELLIKHANESYRLRITNQGKLILTK